MFSPRPASQPSWTEQFAAERETLRRELAKQIRANMAALIGHTPTADVLLVAADGRKLAAHLCILRRRAPSFFRRYVQTTLDAVTPRAATRSSPLLEIAVGDVDSAALEFFVRSIYTDNEALELGGEMNGRDQQQGGDDHSPDDGPNGTDGDGFYGNGTNGYGQRGSNTAFQPRNGAGLEGTRESSAEEEGSLQNGGGSPFQMPALSTLELRSHRQQTADGQQHSREVLAPQPVMSASFPSPERETELVDQFGGSRPLSELRSSSRPSSSLSSVMTSFKELAEGGRHLQCAETGTLARQHQDRKASGNAPAHVNNPKFIALSARDPPANKEGRENELRQQREKASSIFPIFIGMDGATVEQRRDSTGTGLHQIMARSLPSAALEDGGPESPPTNVLGSIRGRAIARRRLSSVSTSLNSLCSVDLLTPTQEGPLPPFGDQSKAASVLASDLLQMYLEDVDTSDVELETRDPAKKVRAHRCVLWAASDYFKEQLTSHFCALGSATGLVPRRSSSCHRPVRLSLVRFSHSSVHFLLQFLYGGVACLPSNVPFCAPSVGDDELDLWELFQLGAFVRCELFLRMLALNLRAMLFHFFHRPCASCVSAVFDALPRMELEIPVLRQLFDEALQWQAVHFTRIWKGRMFLHLSDQWQRRCRDALLQSVDEECVIDVLLGCEKLQVTLPRIKLQGAVQRVLTMVADVEEYCMEFLAGQLDSLIASRAFCLFGKGLALNLALLEDILPPLVHSLSAEAAIRTFLALKESLAQLEQQPPSEAGASTALRSASSSCANSPVKRSNSHGSTGSIASVSNAQQLLAGEWNPRFKGLCHRLFDMVYRHMLHFASSIVQSPDWVLLDGEEQARVREFGLFVEVRMPRAPPPRLSSYGRCYKRSSSAGLGPYHALGSPAPDRTRSLERKSSHGLGYTTSRPSLCTQVEEEAMALSGDRLEEVEERPDRRTELCPDEPKEVAPPVQKSSKIPAAVGKREEPGERKAPAALRPKTPQSPPRVRRPQKERDSAEKREPEHCDAVPSTSGSAPWAETGEENGETTRHRKVARKGEKEQQSGAAESGRAKDERRRKEGVGGKAAADKAPLEGKVFEPSASAALQFERQRTHTVMTVEQNLRAGIIDAYTAGVAKTGKPQSIVRPMPKQQQQSGAEQATSASSGTSQLQQPNAPALRKSAKIGAGGAKGVRSSTTQRKSSALGALATGPGASTATIGGRTSRRDAGTVGGRA